MLGGRDAQGMERKDVMFVSKRGKKESRAYRPVSHTLILIKVMKELTWKLLPDSQSTGR